LLEDGGIVLVNRVDGNDVVTATVDKERLVLSVVIAEGDTRASVKHASGKGLLTVPEVPNSPGPLGLPVKAGNNHSLVIDPVHLLGTGSLMDGELHDRVFSAGVENECVLVSCHSANHFAVGAPTDLGAVISHVGEGDHSLVCPVLMNVPDLDSLVDRVGREQVFAGMVPLHREALT